MKEMQIIKREGLICKVEGEVSLGQSNLAKWEMRCSSWPIGVCHVRGEVEKKVVEGGEVEMVRWQCLGWK